MKIDKEKVIPDEEFSNHAVQGFSYSDCPAKPKRACFSIATGFGGKTIPCEYLDKKEPICHYKEQE